MIFSSVKNTNIATWKGVTDIWYHDAHIAVRPNGTRVWHFKPSVPTLARKQSCWRNQQRWVNSKWRHGMETLSTLNFARRIFPHETLWGIFFFADVNAIAFFIIGDLDFWKVAHSILFHSWVLRLLMTIANYNKTGCNCIVHHLIYSWHICVSLKHETSLLYTTWMHRF